MANRVSDSEVKEIIDTDTDDIAPFIKVANILVTAKLGGQGLSDDQLKEIERWLAAHFVSMRDPRIMSEKTGEASVTYYGKSGLGLDGSQYGQTVKILDTTGILSSIGKMAVKLDVMP